MPFQRISRLPAARISATGSARVHPTASRQDVVLIIFYKGARPGKEDVLIPYRLWVMLAFSRIPGNAFSFWIRRALRWSRGRPALPHETKENLFDYLEGPARTQAENREERLRGRYDLEPLARVSTRALYRKNLYLIDILEEAVRGLDLPSQEPSQAPMDTGAISHAASATSATSATSAANAANAAAVETVATATTGAFKATLAALDVGAQDWHYVFGLERWLRHGSGMGDPEGVVAAEAGRVSLRGVEVDGYGIYPDFRSRKDYAGAYAAQTGNPEVTYEVGDILDATGNGLDVVTVFYPFVTRHHLLLWGLPLRFFRPAKQIAKFAALLRPGGRLLVFTHTLKEHEAFLALVKDSGCFELVKQGRALSTLVDFHEDVEDRRYSVWRRV